MKKTEKKQRKLSNLKPFQSGQSGNPLGRPKGKRNFKTLFEEAAREVAEAKRLGRKPDAVQVELVKRGIKEGLSGKFSFYKDLMDRLYGQAKQPIEYEENEIIIKREFVFEDNKKKI